MARHRWNARRYRDTANQYRYRDKYGYLPTVTGRAIADRRPHFFRLADIVVVVFLRPRAAEHFPTVDLTPFNS